jgi:L-ascorbate metabolism protein UlaG (beta-lactamase superfamily)
MKITWLGHSGFRMEIGDQVLLLDPWLDGNPSFPQDRRAEATRGATALLLTHGHGDHASTAAAIAKEAGIPIACGHELAEGVFEPEGIEAIGFGKGGTITLGEVKVTMVNAVHSNSIDFKGALGHAGSECGFMIEGEGRTVYVSGDTDVMMDMELFEDLHHPEIGILCCGGHYTMDQKRAAYAAKRFFNFRTVIPCHFGTFPILAQSTQELEDALPDVEVVEPKVLVPIRL